MPKIYRDTMVATWAAMGYRGVVGSQLLAVENTVKPVLWAAEIVGNFTDEPKWGDRWRETQDNETWMEGK